MTSPLRAPGLPQAASLIRRWLAPAVQVAVVVASITALWHWMPETLDSWNDPRASDFPNFHGSALLVREGLGDRIYDRSPLRDDDLQEFCRIPPELADERLTFTGPNDACRALEGHFRSPPSLILFYLPGSFLEGDTAYHVTFVVIALASLGLAVWTATFFQSWPARLAVFLAILSLPILQLALRLSQPSALYGLALLGGFVFHARQRPVPAALCFAFLSLKPQFLVLPLAYLIYRRSFPTAFWTASLSLAMFVVGAVLVGPTAMENYVELNIDLAIDGPHILQQAWMYNWQGFAVALTADTQRTAASLLSLSSLLLLAVAVVRRPVGSVPLVAAAAMLIVPYVLFYDWVILCAAAALAIGYMGINRGRIWLGAVFLIVWGGIWATHESLPFFGSQSGDLPDGEIYWSTLSLALGLVAAAVIFELFGEEHEQDAQIRALEAESGRQADGSPG